MMTGFVSRVAEDDKFASELIPTLKYAHAVSYNKDQQKAVKQNMGKGFSKSDDVAIFF
jgi:hypothetical protein